MVSKGSAQYLSKFVRQCDATTSKCADSDTMARKLSGMMANFFYVDKYFDPSSYDQPTKYFLKPYFLSLSNKMYTSLNLYLEKYNFVDDIGVIFEDKHISTELKVSDLRVTFDFREI